MFGIEPSEFLLVAVVALVVIGPKDLPRVMRVLGQWVGRARGMARHFRSGFDEMVRQAELEEMEKRWAAENARIMAEHPTVAPEEEAHDADFAYGKTLPAPDESELVDKSVDAKSEAIEAASDQLALPMGGPSAADEVAAASDKGPKSTGDKA